MKEFTSSRTFKKFSKTFGEEQAWRIVDAAIEHKNGVHDRYGSDPFKWAILICVGYECVGRFSEYHKINVPSDKFKTWARRHGGLSSHDGDVDFLALFAGAYDGFVKPSIWDRIVSLFQ